MRNIILFGPPGSGKGTQAARLAQRYGLHQISTGELLRREQSLGTDLGLQLQQAMARGDLVPDSVVDDLIDNTLRKTDHQHPGYIFDGYPRTINQAFSFQGALAANGMKINFVFELRIDDDLLVERVTGRFACRACGKNFHDRFAFPPNGVCCGEGWTRRPEDNEESLRVRLGRYHNATREVLYHYNQHPYFRLIDASLPMSEVAAKIEACITSVEART